MATNKVEINIWETVRFSRRVIVEIDDIDENELNSLLDQAEREDSADDVAWVLENAGADVIEWPDPDFSSPMDSEVEIVDYRYLD